MKVLNPLTIEQGAVVAVNYTATITFPKAFNSKVVSIVSSPYNEPTNATGDNNYLCVNKNISKTGFTSVYYDSDAVSQRNGYISYIATGY